MDDGGGYHSWVCWWWWEVFMGSLASGEQRLLIFGRGGSYVASGKFFR